MVVEIFAIVALLSGFLFIGCGFSSTNSIEAKNSPKFAHILFILTLIFAIMFCISCIIVLLAAIFPKINNLL